jgi:hypothetical protein
VRSWTLPAAATLLVALAACGGGRGSYGPAPSGVVATAPAAAVEKFLGFARQGHFAEMAYVFGTSRGPLAEQQDARRVQRRMEALARVLHHDSFTMTGVLPEPGRPEARRVRVDLRRGQQVFDVPFLVVQGPAGRWFVEVVDMDAAQQQTRGRN